MIWPQLKTFICFDWGHLTMCIWYTCVLLVSTVTMSCFGRWALHDNDPIDWSPHALLFHIKVEYEAKLHNAWHGLWRRALSSNCTSHSAEGRTEGGVQPHSHIWVVKTSSCLVPWTEKVASLWVNERTRVRTAAACLEGKNAIHYIIRPLAATSMIRTSCTYNLNTFTDSIASQYYHVARHCARCLRMIQMHW